MPGDYSRNTHDPAKHYTRVLMQEGRVQLDADLNENAEDLLHRIVAETRDVIGPSGAPRYGGGFRVERTPGNTDLTLSPGNLYVDGILVENDSETVTAEATGGQRNLSMRKLILDGRPIENGQWLEVITAGDSQLSPVTNVDPENGIVEIQDAALNDDVAARVRRATTFLTQPHDRPAQQLANGRYVAYLEVWEREVSAFDDPDIREVALGGPDTARRAQTVWRVRLRELPGDLNCNDAARQLADAFPPTTGMLAAHTAPPDDDTDPCHLPPTAGYLGLENQLYRVEIHRGGEIPSPGGPGGLPAFKWSRDNASLEVSVVSITGRDVTVTELGKDDFFRFENDQWVEIADDQSWRTNTPNPLRQITVDSGRRVITLNPNAPATVDEHRKVRRWNHGGADATENGIPITGTDWIPLEYGVEVRFAPGIYHPGDWWEIPARTAIRDVVWPDVGGTPDHQPPRGIQRHYVPLAIVNVVDSQVQEQITDCRTPFPPLTHICADDVCFDPTQCRFPANVRNVQQAIDALCELRDFRFLYKHFFGYGVVCGLQLECRGALNIFVRGGYALDCEGELIHVQGPGRDLDLTTLPEWNQLQNENEICVSIARGANGPEFHLARKERRGFLEGTALQEAYEECFERLANYLRDNIRPDETNNDRVSVAQTRLSTLWNLLVQIENPTSGRRAFISPDQHTILAEIYNDLRAMLEISRWNCTRGNLPDFPAYPLAANLPEAVWFGKGDHRRVRSSVDGRFAFTFGSDRFIDVFDANERRMDRRIEFPLGNRNSVVRDIAVSGDNNRIYAIADFENKTYVAVHELRTKQWSDVRAVDSENIAMLALGTNEELYGLGRQKDIYGINPATGATTAKLKLPPSVALEMAGHFLIVEGPRGATVGVVATRGNAATPAGKYDSILPFTISRDGTFRPGQVQNLERVGDEGIAFSLAEDGRSSALFIAADPPADGGKKSIIVSSASNLLTVDLPANTAISLAGLNGGEFPRVAFTSADSNDMRLINTAQGRFADLDPRVWPVQICPSAIAASRTNDIVVLNHGVSTIARFDGPAIANPVPLDPLKQYRDQAVEAFRQLAIQLIDSLKDCLCEHLLIDCPECTQDDIVYLGCLELETAGGARRVRRICGIERRTYVLSPRLIQYWMSFVPIFPAIRRVVERFCCLDVGRLFEDRFRVPPDGDPDAWTCATIPDLNRFSVSRARAPFDSAWADARRRVPFLFDFFTETEQPPMPSDPREIVSNQPIDVARARLERLGIPVQGIERFNPAAGFANLLQPLTSFTPGRPVTLVERDGEVVFAHDRVTGATVGSIRENVDRAIETAEEAKRTVADTGAIREDVEKLRERVEESRRLVDERDGTIRSLNSIVERLQEELRAARQFQTDVEARIETLASKAAAIDELKANVDRLIRRPPIG